MTDEQEIKRLSDLYIKPAVQSLHEKVLRGDPLTDLEMRIWNSIAPSELQIGRLNVAP